MPVKSQAKSQAKSTAADTPSGHNPWLIAVVVALATFMEVLDTTIANVALRYIAGGLAVGPEEAAWVSTTYLVANAITLTASSFLAKRYGRKLFFMASVAVFTLSSIGCGFSESLYTLLTFRIIQGLGGGGMAPLAQSILADTFPPEKRGQAFALYGVAVVFAPAIGPLLGGWLADNWSWHWCFLINAPVGVVALSLMYVLIEDSEAAKKERRALQRKGARFDIVGFLLMATFLGALEVVLDEGQQKDWFGTSPLMNISGIVSAIAFCAMIPYLLIKKDPIVDIRMLGDRQFGSCFLVMLFTGAILISTTQFIPQITQDYYGYTAYLSGKVLAPGGLVTVVMMFVSGRVSGYVQPKWMIAVGASIVSLGLYNLTRIDGTTTFQFFEWSRIYMCVGLPMIFLSITAASYVGIPKDRTDQASALINVARNVGGSLGVSLGQNVLAYRSQFHQDRLVSTVDPSSPFYQETMRQATKYFSQFGYAGVEAQNQATAWIGSVLQQQVAYWAYIDVFWVLAVLTACAVPLALSLKTVPLGRGPAAAE